MSFYKSCECGVRFEVQRDSAKYCSVACSQSAYRERISIKKEQEAYQAAQNAIIEEKRILLEQQKAETGRLLAEQRARQEIFNKEKRERELKSELERKQKQERLRKIKADQREKAMKQAELNENLYLLGGLAVIKAINYISETMQKQPEKPEILPITDNSDPESPA